MNRNKDLKEAKKMIGFIVEGQSDANFVQFMVEDYFNNSFQPKVISMSGKAPMVSSSKIIVASFIEIGVGHIFVMFDTDNFETDKQIEYLTKPLENFGVLDKVTVIPVSPFLETWILSSYVSDIEELRNMDIKSQSEKLRTYGFKRKPLIFSKQNIDFKKMIKNNVEFKKFVNQIEEKIASC